MRAGIAMADVGELDAMRNLYFKGRKKEVIVTPGAECLSEDLEAALRHQPEVKDCVVVGILSARAMCGGDSARETVEAVVRRANESLASTSAFICGWSGRRKIFRAPVRKNLEGS